MLSIIGLSLTVSLTAVFIATLIGLPLGSLLAVTRFPGRQGLIILLNALMGLPPVVAGLAIYLLLSRSGPLGNGGWLFTPAAMIFAQTVLVTPIIAALVRQVAEDLWSRYRPLLLLDGVGSVSSAAMLLWAGRFSLVPIVLAGLGRALAEVGAILIVGGNIAGVTRTMTTTIALETSKGNLSLALQLGAALLGLTLLINAMVQFLSQLAKRLSP